MLLSVIIYKKLKKKVLISFGFYSCPTLSYLPHIELLVGGVDPLLQLVCFLIFLTCDYTMRWGTLLTLFLIFKSVLNWFALTLKFLNKFLLVLQARILIGFTLCFLLRYFLLFFSIFLSWCCFYLSVL